MLSRSQETLKKLLVKIFLLKTFTLVLFIRFTLKSFGKNNYENSYNYHYNLLHNVYFIFIS